MFAVGIIDPLAWFYLPSLRAGTKQVRERLERIAIAHSWQKIKGTAIWKVVIGKVVYGKWKKKF